MQDKKEIISTPALFDDIDTAPSDDPLNDGAVPRPAANINSDNQIFSVGEAAVMDYVLDIRLEMIEGKRASMQEGDPNNGDLRTMDALLVGLENHTQKTAELRISDKNADARGASADATAELLKQLSLTTIPETELVATDDRVSVDDDVIDVDIVPGNLDVDAAPLILEDIMKDADDE